MKDKITVEEKEMLLERWNRIQKEKKEMSKEKPEGEVVTFASKIHLELTVAMAKRLGVQPVDVDKAVEIERNKITQEEVDEIEANGEVTEQEELDLFDDESYKGTGE